MTSDPAYDAVSKAKRQVEGGNPTGAVNTLETYLSTDPHNTRPRLELARVHLYELDDEKAGLFQLDIILDLEPDNVEALKAAVTVLGTHKKHNRETKEKYLKLLELEQSAEVFNMYARFLRRQVADFRTAGEYYEKAIALDPNNVDYHQNYAVLLLNDLRDYKKAKEELEILMRMKPGDYNIKKNYDRLIRDKFDKDGNVKKKRFGFGR